MFKLCHSFSPVPAIKEKEIGKREGREGSNKKERKRDRKRDRVRERKKWGVRKSHGENLI